MNASLAAPKGEQTQALLPVDYQVNENDFITILGPSGCGKSTLLRIVAGLDQPTRGEVWLDGEQVEGPGADRGMVFQSYTLFPWLSVQQNICFGLQERGVSKAAQKERSDYFINKVGPARLRASLPAPAFRRHAAAHRDCPRAGQRPERFY